MDTTPDEGFGANPAPWNEYTVIWPVAGSIEAKSPPADKPTQIIPVLSSNGFAGNPVQRNFFAELVSSRICRVTLPERRSRTKRPALLVIQRAPSREGNVAMTRFSPIEAVYRGR
jgi:hypothetical protein